MQLTVSPPGEEEPRITLTARVEAEPITCGLCGQREAQWFDDPGSVTALDPDAGPINAPEVCETCLNWLLAIDAIVIRELDSRSF